MDSWKVDGHNIDVVKRFTGIDLSGYVRQYRADDIRHIFKRHGSADVELSKGQMPIGVADLRKLPLVNSFPDLVVADSTKGLVRIKYVKQFLDGTVFYVEEVRARHNKVVPVTIRKMKPGVPVIDINGKRLWPRPRKE